jgi:hypothetical protein
MRMRPNFSLDRPGGVSCVFGIEMRRAHAVDSRPSDLARQRAAIRELIEKNGWASLPAPSSEKSLETITSLPSNIIPFPSPEQQTRIS